MGSVFRSHEIYKATSKQVHLKKICSDANCNPEEVIFFDNQMNNCKAVVKLGVTTVFTGSSGVTKQIWQKALQKFPAPGSILKLQRAQWYPFLTQHPNLTTAEHGVTQSQNINIIFVHMYSYISSVCFKKRSFFTGLHTYVFVDNSLSSDSADINQALSSRKRLQ